MRSTVRAIQPRDTSHTPPSPSRAERSVLTAQLSMSPASLVRLLMVSGTQRDFVLSSVDGSTSVKVALSVSSVPHSEVALGGTGATLDWQRSTVMFRGNGVSLSRMELRLLVALLEHAPGSARRADLIATLWDNHAQRGDDHERALSVWICMLRRRLASVGLPDAITTIRSEGYALSL